MVEGNAIGAGEAARRPAGIADLLRSPRAWRSLTRYALLIASAVVMMSVVAGAVPALFGMDSYAIAGGSMHPTVPAGALVVSNRVDPASVRTGEIITFRHASSPDVLVTHRVVKVVREGDGAMTLLTKGDANATADAEPVAVELPVSRLVYSLPYAGWLLEFSRTFAGQAVLIAGPALLLLTSIGRKSTSEAGTPVAASMKVAAVVTASQMSEVVVPAESPASALARLAQRPAPPAPRPGLMRRLVAAMLDEPVAAMPSAASIQVEATLAAAAPAQAAPMQVMQPSMQVTQMAAPPANATSLSLAEDASPLLHLTRMRLRSVARLTDITRSFDRVEAEAAPLLDLVAELDTVRRQFADNLDQAMRPLTEFADRWDENLVTLAAQMQDELPNIDIESERRRIAEIRAQVPHRHSLLLEQFELEKHAIDAALTVFDDQVARLEVQLTAARQTAEAIGDGMRTADFGRTVEFLRRRTERLAALAEGGAATLEDIADALPAASVLAANDEDMLTRSPYLKAVVAVLDDRDEDGRDAMEAAPERAPFGQFGYGAA